MHVDMVDIDVVDDKVPSECKADFNVAQDVSPRYNQHNDNMFFDSLK